MARRRFGNVRKLPSGKFQASFIGPNGKRQNAPNTFRTKTDADRWLVKVESDISRGTWLDDGLGRQRFEDYAKAYLRDNPEVGRRWEETCLRNMRLHMGDLLDVPLVAMSPAMIAAGSPGVRRSSRKTKTATSSITGMTARMRRRI